MRAGIVLIAAAILVSSCGDEPAVTTSLVEANFPSAAVRVWLDAVGTGDRDEIHRVVEPSGEAVIVALENGFDADQLATAATAGLPPDLARQYWASFRSTFEEFRAAELSSLVVMDFELVEDGDAEFAFVEVEGPDGSGAVMARRAPSGQWQVDLVGTLAPALGSRLNDVAELAGSPEAVAKVDDIIRTVVVPALEVAARESSDRTLRSVLDRLRDAVAST